MRPILLLTAGVLLLAACGSNPTNETTGSLTALQAKTPPKLDGIGDDECWKSAPSHLMDHLWVGKLPHAMDYMGKYRVCWDSQYLYVLADIYDDSLVDTHPDGLDRFWDDDCLEIFVDENASGGDHQFNNSAFAYHISLDGKIVDTGIDSTAHYLNDHGIVAIHQEGKVTTWEVALKLYPDTYKDSAENMPVTLASGKVIGFMIAYNDNDKSKERENMMGSVEIKPNPDKNRGWIDASVFEKLTLTTK